MEIEVTDAQMENIQRVLSQRDRDFFQPPESEEILNDKSVIAECMASMLQALTVSVIRAGDAFVFNGDDTLMFCDDESINVDLPNGAQDINTVVSLYGDLFHVFCMRSVMIRATLERAGVASAYLSLFDALCKAEPELYMLCVADHQTNSFKLLVPLPTGEAITQLNLQKLTNCAPSAIALHVACSVDRYESEFVEKTSDSFAHHILTSSSQ